MKNTVNTLATTAKKFVATKIVNMVAEDPVKNIPKLLG